ncbi:MAG: nucleotidyltransferase family protein [Deltaproteobacteria bacterium]|nr:nucleotidyltransferase family protein [Deltaproteobacteria bacterium]
MGTSKQLLPLADKPVIHHCLHALLATEVCPVVVVLSPGGEAVQEAIASFPVTIAWNRDPDGDMAGSVRAGLALLPPDCTGVLVHLVDHPLVTAATMQALCAAHLTMPQSIIIPTCNSRQGHPALFPRTIIAELTPSAILRDIVRKDPARVLRIPVEDEGIFLDMDTPAEYEALRQRVL